MHPRSTPKAAADRLAFYHSVSKGQHLERVGVSVSHGRSGYQYGCRCHICRDAEATHSAERRRYSKIGRRPVLGLGAKNIGAGQTGAMQQP